MKAFLVLVRLIGLAGALLGFYALYLSLSATIPLLSIPDLQIHSFLWRSVFLSYLPGVIFCLLLICPFSLIRSRRIWTICFFAFVIGGIYFCIQQLSDLSEVSIGVFALFACFFLAQGCVICIERLRKKAEQGAAANP